MKKLFSRISVREVLNVSNDSSIMYVLLLLLYFRPDYYVFGLTAYRLGSALLILEFIFLMLRDVIRIKENREKFSVASYMLIFLFFWCIIGSSALNWMRGNSVDFPNAAVVFSTAAGYILLVNQGLSSNPRTFLKSYVTVGVLACTLNALTIFAFAGSGGMNFNDTLTRGHETYFYLSEDNASIFWTLPVIIIAWVYHLQYDRSTRMRCCVIAYTLLTLASYVYVWSVTAIASVAAIIFVIVFYLFMENKSHKQRNKRWKGSLTGKFVNRFTVLCIIALLINYWIAIDQSWRRYFGKLFGIVGKSPTLSGRTTIWNACIQWIQDAIVIGYGHEVSAVTTSKIGLNHTHNILLETLYRGGIVALVLLIGVLLYIGYRSRNNNNKQYQFLMISVFVFLMMCSLDFAFYRYPYLILFVFMDHVLLFPNSAEGSQLPNKKIIQNNGGEKTENNV